MLICFNKLYIFVNIRKHFFYANTRTNEYLKVFFTTPVIEHNMSKYIIEMEVHCWYGYVPVC